MARVKTKLRELRNADVRFISLVDRAATRIPFRVLKRDKETDMGIDLTAILKSDTVEEPKVLTPEVVGLAVHTQESEEVAEKVRQSIAAAGFTTELVQKSENATTIFPQKESEGESVMVRLSDQLVASVTNLPKPTGVFGELVEQEDYVPSFGMAMDVLYDRLAPMVRKSETEQIDATLESFKSYLHAMTALPAAVFKADDGVNEAVQEPEPDPEPEKEEKPAEQTTEQGEVPGLQEGTTSTETQTAEEAGGVKVEKTGNCGPDKKKMEEEDEEEKKKVKKDESTDLQQILAALKGVEERVEAKVAEVVLKVESLVTEQAEQKKVLDGVVQKTDTLNSKLETTVAAPPIPGDRPAGPRTEVQKADNDPRTGCFDTAFMRRRK